MQRRTRIISRFRGRCARRGGRVTMESRAEDFSGLRKTPDTVMRTGGGGGEGTCCGVCGPVRCGAVWWQFGLFTTPPPLRPPHQPSIQPRAAPPTSAIAAASERSRRRRRSCAFSADCVACHDHHRPRQRSKREVLPRAIAGGHLPPPSPSSPPPPPPPSPQLPWAG